MSGEAVAEFPVHRASALAFSPCNSFLLCWSKANKDEKNLNMFRLADGNGAAPCLSVFQKHFSRDAWPSVQWSSDEALACRCVNNEVHFFDGTDFGKGIIKKLRLPSVEAAALSPADAQNTLVACYVPEVKGAPASVTLFETAQLTPKGDAPAPIARKSFFKCSSCSFMWNAKGTAVIVQTASEVDTANKSYYGASNLHFLTADGSYEGAVPLSKEGPVHDVQWSPAGDEFLVTYGFMPAKSTLFSASCEVLQQLGAGPHNIVRFNPFGSYFAICGFGNLPGDVEIYERKARNWAKLNSVRVSNAVDLEWSPDGLAFLTSTVSPRLRVDNGFKVFNAAGQQLSHVEFPVLYAASWQPAPRGKYERRVLPKDLAMAAKEAVAAVPAQKKVEAFKPRHLRGLGSGNFSLAADDDDLKGKAQAACARYKASRPGIPGSEPVAMTKNQKKAAAKKKAKAKKAVEAEQESSQAAIKQQQQQAGADGGKESAPVQEASPVAPQDPAKRLRNLRKKLKQTEDLEKKVAEGLAPSAEQQAKLDTKQSLLDEIAALEI